MKYKELTSWGITGKRVEFNLMDCYEASHTLARIDAVLNGEEQQLEVECLLQMMSNLLSKIALKPSEDASIFAAEESEEKES